jgi:hypothetical protein
LCDASNDNITQTLPHNKMYVISYHETNHTNGWTAYALLHCPSNRNESQYSDSPSNPILVSR